MYVLRASTRSLGFECALPDIIIVDELVVLSMTLSLASSTTVFDPSVLYYYCTTWLTPLPPTPSTPIQSGSHTSCFCRLRSEVQGTTLWRVIIIRRGWKYWAPSTEETEFPSPHSFLGYHIHTSDEGTWGVRGIIMWLAFLCTNHGEMLRNSQLPPKIC